MPSEIRQNPTTRLRRLSREEKREMERRGKQERASRLVAEDDLSDEKIAAEVGIHRDTLFEWKKLPEFKARVAEHVAEITYQIMHSGYCRVDKRLALLNKNVNRLEAVIKAKRDQVLRERAAKRPEAGFSETLDDDEEMEQHYAQSLSELAAQPGADQGILIRKETPVKHGVQVEYLIATNVIAEERALLKHIAVETGEWIERIGGNLSLDSALAGLLGKVGPGEEEAGSGDSGDLADQAPEGV